jgi:hypothetical protein
LEANIPSVKRSQFIHNSFVAFEAIAYGDHSTRAGHIG